MVLSRFNSPDLQILNISATPLHSCRKVNSFCAVSDRKTWISEVPGAKKVTEFNIVQLDLLPPSREGEITLLWPCALHPSSPVFTVHCWLTEVPHSDNHGPLCSFYIQVTSFLL